MKLTKKRKAALYRSEAEHILGHATEKGTHGPYSTQGNCEQCIAMIVGALEMAERVGRTGEDPDPDEA